MAWKDRVRDVTKCIALVFVSSVTLLALVVTISRVAPGFSAGVFHAVHSFVLRAKAEPLMDEFKFSRIQYIEFWAVPGWVVADHPSYRIKVDFVHKERKLKITREQTNSEAREPAGVNCQLEKTEADYERMHQALLAARVQKQNYGILSRKSRTLYASISYHALISVLYPFEDPGREVTQPDAPVIVADALKAMVNPLLDHCRLEP